MTAVLRIEIGGQALPIAALAAMTQAFTHLQVFDVNARWELLSDGPESEANSACHYLAALASRNPLLKILRVREGLDDTALWPSWRTAPACAGSAVRLATSLLPPSWPWPRAVLN